MEDVRQKIIDILFDGGFVNMKHNAYEKAEEIMGLMKKSESVDEVPCSVGLSDDELKMDAIFCIALIKTLSISDPKLTEILTEYRSLMARKEEVLKELKGR